MRIPVHPGPAVVHLKTIYHKGDAAPVRVVIRTLRIIKLCAQGIHDRLTFVSALCRRMQFIVYFVADSRRFALLFIPGRWRFRTPRVWTGVVLRGWTGAGRRFAGF